MQRWKVAAVGRVRVKTLCTVFIKFKFHNLERQTLADVMHPYLLVFQALISELSEKSEFPLCNLRLRCFVTLTKAVYLWCTSLCNKQCIKTSHTFRVQR